MDTFSRVLETARIELSEEYAKNNFVSLEAVEEAVIAANNFVQDRTGKSLGEKELSSAKAELEGMFNVFVGREHVLLNNDGHEEWFDKRRAEISWNFWDRYRRWLVEDEHRPEAVVEGSLNPITDQILSMLEDPKRPGRWSRRGLVAGQVQSGKTSNYVGLINKALDAGYKLIVVLAGTHDNLRSQTQSRINTGVLGFETQRNFTGHQVGKRVGVGLKPGAILPLHCPTTSDQKGDFNRRMAGGVGKLGSDPVILVVKKNTSILRNLAAWATGLNHEIDPVSGKKVVRNVPLLVIDDEADYASVDTGSVKDKVTGEESDPSMTNRLIRELLEAFEQSAYVGYTATPFANIFINSAANHQDFGRDLFPEHFIVTLPETTAYSGPARVFGLREDESAGIEGVAALPTTRTVDDYGAWLPDGHRKGDLPSEDLPDSLMDAVDSFLLASAVKRARGVSMKHNSMLVHVTRFVDVQARVAAQLSDYVSELRSDILYSDPASAQGAWPRLAALYASDFADVHRTLDERGELDSQSAELPNFGALAEHLGVVTSEIAVKTINGEAKDALQYNESPEGITVIAVGGDKLSRGLTLDGLTTSYYLRASKMYDTLMQMGRWFGYRPGYLDVCRLYTTKQLQTWYGRITSASERLYREFELMAALGKTPRDFGLRVERHPDGLMVTSPAKSRLAKNVRASFSGTVSETILFLNTNESRINNAKALKALYRDISLDPAVEVVPVRPFYWRNVPASAVLRFIESYNGHDSAVRALPKAMAEYIRASLALPDPELVHWDVLVATRPDVSDTFELGDGREVGLIERNRQTDAKHDDNTYVIGRLVSSGDEVLPLYGDQGDWDRALSFATENWLQSTRSKKAEEAPVRPTAVAERRVRSPKRGFLMIYPLMREPAGLTSKSEPLVGFAVAFPWSDHAPSVDYRVNDIYWDLEMRSVLDEVDDVE